jgi:formamidopyrimidine-DNA glycosylase
MQFDDLWRDASALLAIGVKRNAIITVDELSISGPMARPLKRERLNIFNKTTCPRCTHDIDALLIGGRRAFVCTTCQPIVKADQ